MLPFAQQAVRSTERRLQSVAAARRHGRRWKRRKPQYLVMIDKLHDMHERHVISDLQFAQWSDWACEHVTRHVELYRACAM